jgi:hypothetical protein
MHPEIDLRNWEQFMARPYLTRCWYVLDLHHLDGELVEVNGDQIGGFGQQ